MEAPLGDLAEHQGDGESDAGIVEADHQIADDAEDQGDVDIADLGLQRVSADQGDDGDRRHQDMDVDHGQERQAAGEGKDDQGGENAGDRQRQDQGEDDVLMLEQDGRAGIEAVEDQHAEENRGLGAARYAEGQRRDQRAAVLGVIGRFRGDDAEDVALAVGLRVLRHLHLGGIGKERRHGAADAGDGADEGADGGAAQHGGVVLEHRLDAIEDLLDLHDLRVLGDGAALDR